MENKPHMRHRRRIGAEPIIVIIIIIAIIAYASTTGSSIKTITQNYSFALAKGTAQNFMLSSGKAFSVYLNSSTNSMAYLSLGSIPILPGQVTNIAIPKGQSVNVSLNGSQYSDIELKAVSTNNTGAVLSIIQIPKGIKISSGASTTATTSITATGSTTASSTVQTTAINTSISALQAFNSTNVGSLMHNYGSLYSATQGCTASSYNSTYISSQHSAPSGPNSYYNVSAITPYGITVGIGEVSAGTYNLTYTTKSKTTSSKVLSAEFSYPANAIISYSFSGTFSGLTYSQLLSNYNSQNSIASPCAALIP